MSITKYQIFVKVAELGEPHPGGGGPGLPSPP